MISSRFALCILGLTILTFPGFAHAQEATFTGTITDATGAILPGVTITATHETTGNRFTTVTDERGAYRIPVRIGRYDISAELQGFTTAMRSGVELLVGQTVTLNLQLAPSGVQETVTVSAEAPLLDVATSTLGGNVDTRQVQELPVAGRNWMSLSLLAPGNRTNDQGATPVQDRGDVREFQLNVDGVAVTANLGTGNQSRYSIDSVAEFQFISNRFDATQGRSSGVQVNAVTKSGTNRLSGSFLGNFRDSQWNARDPVLDRVVPYSNQQFSMTLGGPIVINRLHYFANYEYERQPLTGIWDTPYPAFNIELQGTRNVKLGGVRGDYELTPNIRLMGKGSASRLTEPFSTTGATNPLNNHPSGASSNKEHNTDALGQLTQVLSNRMLNEVRVGYAAYGLNQASLTSWSKHWQAANGITNGGPNINFRGFRTGRNGNLPRYRDQSVWSVRDNFTFSYDAAGRHDLKAGAEYLRLLDNTRNCNQCGGTITANAGPVPSNIEQILADPFNADTWDLNALASITSSYQVGVSDASQFLTPLHLDKSAAWVQDDWKVSQRLTLNLGLRYDLIWNAFAQSVTFEPFMEADRPQDANNIQPRVGLAYQLNDRTVIRGGSGLYYNDVLNTNVLWPQSPLTIAVIRVDNDGRADFPSNPFNGSLPSFAQALTYFCSAPEQAAAFAAWQAGGFTGTSPCLLRDLQELSPISEYAHVTHSWQSSIGFARQVGNNVAFEMDYVNTRGRDEKSIQDNVNLTFNSATGTPYPYSDVAHRAFPAYGVVGMIPHIGKSDYHGLQTSLTKRLSNRWQGSLTYTLSGLWDEDPPPLSGFQAVTFPVAADLGGERSLAATDQRHRLVFNGIWQVGRGFQVSGIYFYGSGSRDQEVCGCDARGLEIESIDRLVDGATGAYASLNGTILPRNDFVGDPIHRVELRLQQRVPINRVNLEGYVDVFNLLNRANYGSYTLEVTSSQFRQPQQSSNLSYAPRTVQLGFRATF